MSDLRKAAEAVATNAGIPVAGPYWMSVSRIDIERLRAALSAPDPVAEAREIIAGMLPHVNEYLIVEGKARDWLARNGGEE